VDVWRNSSPESPPCRGRILVIDDNPSILETLRCFLPTLGHLPTLAEDPEEGLKIAAKCPVDLVLTDYEMPGMSGLAVCATIKRIPALRHLPVVLMTGRPSPELFGQAFAAGARAVITKPFDLNLLETTLADSLARP